MAAFTSTHVNMQPIPMDSALRHMPDSFVNSLFQYAQVRMSTASTDVEDTETEVPDFRKLVAEAQDRFKRYPPEMVERKAKAEDVEMMIELGLRFVPCRSTYLHALLELIMMLAYSHRTAGNTLGVALPRTRWRPTISGPKLKSQRQPNSNEVSRQVQPATTPHISSISISTITPSLLCRTRDSVPTSQHLLGSSRLPHYLSHGAWNGFSKIFICSKNGYEPNSRRRHLGTNRCGPLGKSGRKRWR